LGRKGHSFKKRGKIMVNDQLPIFRPASVIVNMVEEKSILNQFIIANLTFTQYEVDVIFGKLWYLVTNILIKYDDDIKTTFKKNIAELETVLDYVIADADNDILKPGILDIENFILANEKTIVDFYEDISGYIHERCIDVFLVMLKDSIILREKINIPLEEYKFVKSIGKDAWLSRL
jgi:hypothetical protein